MSDNKFAGLLLWSFQSIVEHIKNYVSNCENPSLSRQSPYVSFQGQTEHLYDRRDARVFFKLQSVAVQKITILISVVATGNYHIFECDVCYGLFLVATMVATGS